MAGDVGAPAAPVAPRFEDIAATAGIAYQYDHGPRDDLYLADTMGGGVGLFDYDGDGRLDIYFVNGCALPYNRDDPPTPNRLYRNRGDGTFEDVTGAAGVGGIGYGMGCAVGDIDNDGDDDLFVTGLDRTVLYRNLGDGTFQDVTESAGVASDRWSTAAGFGDLDSDGDLDLYVVTYVDGGAEARPCRDHAGKPIHCSPGQYPAQPDHLFRNNGDGTFTDVAPEAGIDAPGGRGLGLAIADLDGDGRLDLYVANDASADFAFRNLGGLRFEESGALWGLAVDGSGHATASMGVVADDLTGDGLIDLFHTNFLNESNTLHRNLGGGQFTDATLSAGLAAPSLAVTGFGSAAIDIDNDGRPDLFIANGHVDDQTWVNSPIAQLPQCYMGRDDGRFFLSPTGAFPYLAHPDPDRIAGGDRDHRRAHRPGVAARRAGGPRGRLARPVHQQPQAARPGDADRRAAGFGRVALPRHRRQLPDGGRLPELANAGGGPAAGSGRTSAHSMAMSQFYEQGNVYNSLNHQPDDLLWRRTAPPTASGSARFGARATPRMIGLHYPGAPRDGWDDSPIPMTFSSYAASSGVLYYHAPRNSPATAGLIGQNSGIFMHVGRPSGFNPPNVASGKVVGIADIRDGTSNTIMLADKSYGRIAIGTGDQFGPNWWSSGLIGDTTYAAIFPPNYFKSVAAATALPQYYPEQGVTCNFLATANSFHPGGCNFAFCDGSVRFIKDTVNSWNPLLVQYTGRTTTYTGAGGALPQQGVYQSLHTRKGGEVISADQF